MYIKVQDLSKVIGKNIILDHINLEMESGYIYGIKGKNGSGKTMLMRAICGLIKPTSGSVEIDGEVLGKNHSFPNSVGVLIEHPGFIPQYSGYENLKYLIRIRKRVDERRISQVMRMVGLNPMEKKAFKKYSLGMKQKLGIAAAIIENPDLVILDEPINALDEDSIDTVKEILMDLKKEGKLVILSCHDTEELLQVSDVVITMKAGKVADTNTKRS